MCYQKPNFNQLFLGVLSAFSVSRLREFCVRLTFKSLKLIFLAQLGQFWRRGQKSFISPVENWPRQLLGDFYNEHWVTF